MINKEGRKGSNVTPVKRDRFFMRNHKENYVWYTTV